jgi:3-methyladenine DNA glycosylase AlkD
MDRWCKDFDSWGICDTATFVLFDRTPFAWKKVKQWAARKDEFVRRAAFAMIASLSVHDKQCGDEPFAEALALVEQYSEDDRHWVKLAVNWALRSIGKRSPHLHSAAVALATKLATSESAVPRWIGKDALRDLHSKASQSRLARQKK